MTQWYEVKSPPRIREMAAGALDGMTWHVLVVDGRVAACSSFPHCPAHIGEGWGALMTKWASWGDWSVAMLPYPHELAQEKDPRE